MYQYDKGGNRVSEKLYAYTLSDSLGTVQQEIVSEYDNIVWDDLLTSYNGKEITYDNAGNPTSYDGKTFVWNGKQLKQITSADGSKTLFNYDANGLRTRKVQYDETNRLSYYVEYIWADGKIVSQYLTLIAYVTYSDGSTKSVPIGPIPSKVIYDDNGIPQGFTCGEATFGFVRNLQGDVIAMVDFEGNIVMEYSYDPWGNIEYHFNEEVTTEEEAVIYTALCPFTYRGYNYDFTTGLYYLQSRYYNPEWGRFLNCDDTAILLSTQGETHNANLFAYCDNNPVNRVDYEGYDSNEIVAEVVSLIGAALILDRVRETYMKEILFVVSYYDVINKKETSGIFINDFSCNYTINNDVTFLEIKITMRGHNAKLKYCEYNIEIRNNDSWEYELRGGKIGNLYSDLSDAFFFEDLALSAISPTYAFVSGGIAITYDLYKNYSWRNRYINYQMEQQSIYGDDATALLNRYSHYEKEKIFSRTTMVNYVERDCVKEYKEWHRENQ